MFNVVALYCHANPSHKVMWLHNHEMAITKVAVIVAEEQKHWYSSVEKLECSFTACKCSHYGKEFNDSSLRQTQIYHVTHEFYYEVICQKELKTGHLIRACSQIVIASLLTVPNSRNNSGSLNRQMDKQIVEYAYKGKHQSLHVVCPQSDLEGFILWELKSIWNCLKTKWTKQKQANWVFGYSVWVKCVCDRIKWAFPVEEQQSHWGSVRDTSIESESKVPMKLS